MAWQDGLYITEGSGFRVDLRVDLGGAGGEITPTISCDLIRLVNPVLFGTFRSRTDQDIVRTDGERIEATLARLGGSELVKVILYLSPSGSRLVDFDGGTYDPSFRITLSVTSAHPGSMRVINLEIDRDVSVPFPVSEWAYGESSREVSLFPLLREAGIEPRVGIISNEIATFPTATWNRAMLNNAINNLDVQSGQPRWNSVFRNDADWNVYVLLLRGLTGEPTTAGLMPDRKRRGAAIFTDVIKAITTNSRAENLRYLFTVVHEIGHSFNLPHSFENILFPGDGSTRLTFMNYPHKYTGDGSFDSDAFHFIDRREVFFFSNFTFRFSPEELLELRHGNLSTIVMGGEDYRGSLRGSTVVTPHSRIDQTTVDPEGLRLELRLRRPRKDHLFEFGEPIHVELQLETSSPEPIAITEHLDPLTHDVVFTIRRPDGASVQFEPPFTRCAVPEKQSVDATTALYANVCLEVSRHGFTFIEPGFYLVRALLRRGGRLIVSNLLQLYVRYPSPKVEDAVVPVLIDEVADYLMLQGGHHLDTARNRLGELTQKLPSHPLCAYYNLYEATTQAHGFWDLAADSDDPRIRTVTECVTPKSNIALFCQALGLTVPGQSTQHQARRSKKAPINPLAVFSNLFLGKMGQYLHDVLSDHGAEEAKPFRKQLRKALRAKPRSVPAKHLGPN